MRQEQLTASLSEDGQSISVVKRKLRRYIEKKLVPFLWGPPGIGKSDLVAQVAREMGMKLNDVRLTNQAEVDIRGIPRVNHETARTEWTPPSWLPFRDPKTGKGIDGPGILFLDELASVRVPIKVAISQLILNRKIGEYELPDDWAIVAAGNREQDNCGVLPLTRMLGNRMVHVNVTHSFDEWQKWALDNDIENDIIGFLAAHRQYFYRLDVTARHDATPRTWHMASKAIKGETDFEFRKELLAGCVGEPIAIAYKAWYNTYRSVRPDEIVKGRMPDVSGLSASEIIAYVFSLIFYIRENEITDQQSVLNVSNFLAMIPKEMHAVFFNNLPKGAVGLRMLRLFAQHPEARSVLQAFEG